MASSRVSPATKRRAIRGVVPLDVTHLARRGLSESLRSVARSMPYDYARVIPQRLVRVSFQELFGIESGHATGASSGYGLAVAVVLHVAGNKDAWNGSQGAVFGDQGAVRVHVELTFEDRRVGIVADGDEDAIYCDFASFLRLRIAKARAFDMPLWGKIC